MGTGLGRGTLLQRALPPRIPPRTRKRNPAMSSLPSVWILGDQLSPAISALEGLAPGACTVLMIESHDHARRLPYHKHKLVLLWSAMRHFAEELRSLGYTVDYHAAAPSFADALDTHLRHYTPDRVRLMATADYGIDTMLAALLAERSVAVDITPNNLFLSDAAWFQKHAKGRKTLLMESFYRAMRKKTGLLMEDGQPIGGAWNYDKENRARPPKGHRFPEVRGFPPDATTREVMAIVEAEFPDHFGTLDQFRWPVTRADAEALFRAFLDERLDLFGPYQDAIVTGEPFLYHSLISPLINIGLLDPMAVCREAEVRYHAGTARLNSVEGFIRQVIGWREYVYQVYRMEMPAYIASNHFGHDIPIPAFYWNADTDMACVREAVSNLRVHGINHHIQRLMITGNFALIAGINPQQVNDWYLEAYADAYEWVVTPNVLGMALYADGGLLATKPYAASANYIHKMSDCCTGCAYNHKEAIGDHACPFNSLYWDFLIRNRQQLEKNHRMGLILKNLDKQDAKRLAALRDRANHLRETLRRGQRL